MTKFVQSVLLAAVFAVAGISAPAAESPATTPRISADEAFAAFEALALAAAETSDPGLYEIELLRVSAASTKFFVDYPDDPRRWRVVHNFAINSNVLLKGAQRREALVSTRVSQGLQARDIEPLDWQRLKFYEIRSLVATAHATGSAGNRDKLSAVRRSIDEFAARYPQSSMITSIERDYLGLVVDQNPTAEKDWLNHLVGNANEQVAEFASGRLRLLQLKDQPLQMKFTAIDGRQVDLEQLRGKVVLVDFWATWCGPCVAELPKIREAYDRYHRLGFEVIGISLDQPTDRDKLNAFIKARGYPWPQFLDMDNKHNRFAVQFGVTAIPQQVLLDQTGRMVTDNARGEVLEREIRRLLAL